MVNPFWICPASWTLYIHPILCARLLDSFSAPWSIAGTPHFSIPTPVIGSRVSQRLSPLHNLVSCKASGSGEDVVIWSNPPGLAWSHCSSSFGFNSSLGIIKHIRSISFWKHLKNRHSAGTTKQATFDTDVRHGHDTLDTLGPYPEAMTSPLPQDLAVGCRKNAMSGPTMTRCLLNGFQERSQPTALRGISLWFWRYI